MDKYYTVHYAANIKQPVRTTDLAQLVNLPVGTHVRAWVEDDKQVVDVWGAPIIDGVARFDLSARGTLEEGRGRRVPVDWAFPEAQGERWPPQPGVRSDTL